MAGSVDVTAMAKPETAAMVEKLLPHLRCPLTLIRQGREVALIRQGDALVSPDGLRYPIVANVPDLRPRAGEAVDHYAQIHAVQARSEPAPDADVLARLADAYGLKDGELTGRSVLVAGAALGTEVAMMLALGADEVFALDYAGHIRTLPARLNAPKGRVHYVQGDVCALPFAARYFDLTFSSGVLQHTPSPELGFREIHRVTKDGGHINLAIPYPDSPHHRNITRARLKHRFHAMPPAEAEKRLARRLRRRVAMERIGLARLDYRLTSGMAFPAQGAGFAIRLGAALDTYYPAYRHTLDPNEVRRWFLDLGMTPKLPRNIAPHFGDVPESALGATKSYTAVRPAR